MAPTNDEQRSGDSRVAVIGGASGFIGTALVRRLKREGWEVRRLVRAPRRAGPGEVGWDLDAGTIDTDGLEGVNAVINLAGAGIADRRWNDTYRRTLVDSRVRSTKLLAATIAGLTSPPQVFLSGSAMGYYGSRGDETLRETSAAGQGFLPDLVQQWERAAQSAIDTGIRTVFLRTSLVLSTAGGVLPRLLIPFKLGLGGKLGSGDQWMSWISLEDEINAILHLIDNPAPGPANLASPNPLTNAEFTKVLGRVLNRPTFLSVPAFAPRLALGTEMANALLFDSARLEPTVLEDSGFSFADPLLEPFLRTALDRPEES